MIKLPEVSSAQISSVGFQYHSLCLIIFHIYTCIKLEQFLSRILNDIPAKYLAS